MFVFANEVYLQRSRLNREELLIDYGAQQVTFEECDSMFGVNEQLGAEFILSKSPSLFRRAERRKGHSLRGG